MQVVAGN